MPLWLNEIDSFADGAIAALKNDERVFENAFQSILGMIHGAGFEKGGGQRQDHLRLHPLPRRQKTPSACTMRSTALSSYVRMRPRGPAGDGLRAGWESRATLGPSSWSFSLLPLPGLLSGSQEPALHLPFRRAGPAGALRQDQPGDSQTLEDPMILAMNLFDSQTTTGAIWPTSAGWRRGPSSSSLKTTVPLGACSTTSGTTSAPSVTATWSACWSSSRLSRFP